MDEHESAQAPETVWLRHPYTGDVQEVEARPEKLTSWMVCGYVQTKPANPAQGE